jgi:thiosulfate reductase / polysulfide reductase chain A
MSTSSVYSMCGMCAVRCPIRVEVEDGAVTWLEGNPHAAGIQGSLCARGSAGIAFQRDAERPQHPMIRTGPRGSGEWRKASWDEALDHVAAKLRAVAAKGGPRAIALADRGGPFVDLTKSFLKAIGSPNYFDHDDSCASNVNNACKTLFGYGRGDLVYDFANAKHIVLYGRNVFESLQVKEVNTVLDALDAGAKLTYVDVRATVTASKADRFLMIRPGTDYALNLGLIHVLLRERLHDEDFVRRWVTGVSELETFVRPCTPEWAAEETGIPAAEIVQLARELGAARPRVIFHAGWMMARYGDSFYASRTLHILNALLGNFEKEGGLAVAKGPSDAGARPLRSLGAGIPDVKEPGLEAGMPGGPLGTGHLVNLYKAVRTGQPYPIQAFLAYRFDPLASFPDPEAQKSLLEKLDLLVAIDVNYSDTAWHADVILPEATYLERSNILATQKGLKPSFAMRRQAVPPRYDAKPAWEIFTLLAERMGAGRFFPYRSIEDVWRRQLEGTGLAVEDFAAKGFVALAKKPIFMPAEGLKLKTPSGKIEIVSSALEERGIPSLKAYARPARPEAGSFRLTFGRSAVHTHAQSQNNPLLNEILPENTLWVNEAEAAKIGVKTGDTVEVSAGGERGRIEAFVTPFIHPEAVFMLHGFGNEVPAKTRSFRRGLRDTRFAKGLLETIDPVGGGVANLEAIVKVRKVQE